MDFVTSDDSLARAIIESSWSRERTSEELKNFVEQRHDLLEDIDLALGVLL